MSNEYLPNNINSVDMKHHLRMAVETKVPVMFWGPAGVGKTQIIESFAKDKNYYFIDFLLVIRDAVDIHGVPVTEPFGEGGGMRTGWAIPKEIPMEGDSQWDDKIIIFLLDELTTASSETQAAALKMVNEHKLDSQRLHPNVRFVAAANPKSTKSHYNELLPPLKNRFKHYNLKAEREPWVDHAIEVDMNPAVIGFIGQGSCSSEAFHIDNAKDSKAYTAALEGNAFQTGRTWEFLSQGITLLEKMHPQKGDEFYRLLGQEVYGTVGAASGALFMTYYKNAMAMPTPEQICKGNFKKGEEYTQGQRFYITTSLGLHLRHLAGSIKSKITLDGENENSYKRDDNYTTSLQNSMSFLGDLDSEMLTVFMMNFFKIHKLGFDFALNKEIAQELSQNAELKMYITGLDV